MSNIAAMIMAAFVTVIIFACSLMIIEPTIFPYHADAWKVCNQKAEELGGIIQTRSVCIFSCVRETNVNGMTNYAKWLLTGKRVVECESVDFGTDYELINNSIKTTAKVGKFYEYVD